MIRRQTKKLVTYGAAGEYAAIMPVYYQNEESPAWRKMAVGSKEYCESALKDCPDYMLANDAENSTNRKSRWAEAALLDSIGKHKQAAKIKAQYGLSHATEA